MKRFPHTLMATLFLSSALVAPAIAADAAQSDFYKIDPAKSSIEFQLDRSGKPVTLKFKEFEGVLTIDKSNPEHKGLTLVIYTDSVQSGDAKLDADLKGAKFFDNAGFGLITFSTTNASWKKTGDNAYDMPGNLRIRDIEHNGTLMKAVNVGAVGGKADRQLWQASGVIKRKPYGLVGTPGLAGDLSDDVNVTMKFETQKID